MVVADQERLIKYIDALVLKAEYHTWTDKEDRVMDTACFIALNFFLFDGILLRIAWRLASVHIDYELSIPAIHDP